MKTKNLLIRVAFALSVSSAMAQNNISVSAPITSELMSKQAPQALASVFQIINGGAGKTGTGFLHESGKVITAAHVLAPEGANGSNPAPWNTTNLFIRLPTGESIPVSEFRVNIDWDLALLTPVTKIPGPSLIISKTNSIPLGTQVSTWGFPAGYANLVPLLTLGYVAGIDVVASASGQPVQRFVINAAFNSGNSGGPLISMVDGSVIGVVSSKLAPVPQHIIDILNLLSNSQSGVAYAFKRPDGQEVMITEGRFTAEVLTYLRSQTQLVIGHAVSTGQLMIFLNETEKKN